MIRSYNFGRITVRAEFSASHDSWNGVKPDSWSLVAIDGEDEIWEKVSWADDPKADAKAFAAEVEAWLNKPDKSFEADPFLELELRSAVAKSVAGVIR